MNVEQSIVKKLLISDMKHMDTITVFLEDLAERQGKITISCYKDSWTAYWGGIGKRTIAEFFLMCGEDYIASNLAPGIPATVIDVENMADHARRHILSERKHGGMSRLEARELFGRTDNLEDLENDTMLFHVHSGLMNDIFGDDWYTSLPSVPNGKYTYLCRIIKAVKEALELLKRGEGEVEQ
jgi:hypothetical protein